MCQHCDTPEMRAEVREVCEGVGIDADTTNRVILALTRPVLDESEGRWTDPADAGTITLTKGEGFLLAATVLGTIKDGLNQGAAALDFSKGMGVPMDALTDMEAVNAKMIQALDLLDKVEAARVDTADAVLSVPDDLSSLVGDGDGSTT
jgi:hypothetical protein